MVDIGPADIVIVGVAGTGLWYAGFGELEVVAGALYAWFAVYLFLKLTIVFLENHAPRSIVGN
ncbi:hypothetical protein [Natrinema thermotolerans]